MLYTCHRAKLFYRFLFLLLLKPVTAYFSRLTLARKMRKILLQKDSGHGDSKVLRELDAQRKANLLSSSTKRKSREDGEKLNESDDMRNLNYTRLKRSIIKSSWPYFGCTCLFTLFCIFPRHHYAPYPNQDLVAGLPLNETATVVRGQHAWVQVQWDQALYLDADALLAVVELANNSYCPGDDGSRIDEIFNGWANNDHRDGTDTSVPNVERLQALLEQVQWRLSLYLESAYIRDNYLLQQLIERSTSSNATYLREWLLDLNFYAWT